jgi:hypothetical protein
MALNISFIDENNLEHNKRSHQISNLKQPRNLANCIVHIEGAGHFDGVTHLYSSGSIISDDGWVLTAGHSLSKMHNYAKSKSNISQKRQVTATTQNGEVYVANVHQIYLNEAYDFGLMKLEAYKDEEPNTIITAHPQSSRKILIKSYLEERHRQLNGTILPQKLEKDVLKHEIIMDVKPIQGYSGSPILSTEGHFIGIFHSGWESYPQRGIGSSSYAIRRFIEKIR